MRKDPERIQRVKAIIMTVHRGILALAAGSVFFLIGCGSPPTNAPTAEEVAKADEARAAAIDNDPSLTPEGKAKMKEAMGLGERAKSGR